METQEIKMADELQQLKMQYESLKEDVDRQNTINEKFILSSIRKDLRIINSKPMISLVAGTIAVPLIILLSLNLGLSLPFMIISAAWLLFLIVGNWIRNRHVDIDPLSSGTLQSFVSEMKKRKNNQFKWFRINFPAMILWIGCFIGECIRVGMAKEMLLPVICGICVGAVIGIVIAFKMHNTIIGAYEGVILELENPEVSHTIK